MFLLLCRYVYAYWVFSQCLSILSVCTLINFQLCLWRQLFLWTLLYLSTIFVSAKVITVVWYIYIASMLTVYACYTLRVHRPLTTGRKLFESFRCQTIFTIKFHCRVKFVFPRKWWAGDVSKSSAWLSFSWSVPVLLLMI